MPCTQISQLTERWSCFLRKDLSNWQLQRHYFLTVLYHVLLLTLQKGSGRETVSLFYLFSLKYKSIPTNHLLWSACFTCPLSWEMLSTSVISKSSYQIVTLILVSCWVVFLLKYHFYHPVALGVLLRLHWWFWAVLLQVAQFLCFILGNSFVMLLCILCHLFRVFESVINKLFHYAPGNIWVIF